MASVGNNRPHMNWEAADLKKEWQRFKQHCDFTFNGPLEGKSEKVKVNYVTTCIGDTKAMKYITPLPGPQLKVSILLRMKSLRKFTQNIPTIWHPKRLK